LAVVVSGQSRRQGLGVKAVSMELDSIDYRDVAKKKCCRLEEQCRQLTSVKWSLAVVFRGQSKSQGFGNKAVRMELVGDRAKDRSLVSKQ